MMTLTLQSARLTPVLAGRRDAWQGAAIGAGVAARDEPAGRVGVHYPDWRSQPELARADTILGLAA
jgi:hypothetical protein